MFSERRRHQRHIINRVAKYQTEHGALPRECTITDISESGARLFVADAEVPDHFVLLISGERPTQEDCQLAWRLGGEVGVSFITHQRAKQRLEVMNRLRAEAQQIQHDQNR